MQMGLFAGLQPTTAALATLVGAYLCVSAAGLLRKTHMERFIRSLRGSPAAMHGVGAVAFFVGATILLVHRDWSEPVALLVNLVALMWVVEGGGMLAQPELVSRFLEAPAAARRLRLMTAATGVLGSILLAIGIAASGTRP